MKLSTRTFKYRWHKFFGTKQIRINGVKVSTSLEDISPTVQKDLFRGTYEDIECQFVEQFIRPNNRVLEVGCGIGLVSLVASRICANGSVKSYEANPHLENLIKKNYALNGLSPDLEMKAITVDGDNHDFFIDPEIISSSQFDRKKGHQKEIVNSVALDDVINSYRPDTIIMDVEGAEVELLGKSLLTGISQIVIELHPHIVGNKKVNYLKEKLAENGFGIIAQKGKVYFFKR